MEDSEYIQDEYDTVDLVVWEEYEEYAKGEDCGRGVSPKD